MEYRTRILSGKILAEEIIHRQKKIIAEKKLAPKLAIMLVGDNPESLGYIKIKTRQAQKIGIEVALQHLPADTTLKQLQVATEKLNHDHTVSGIILQLPLPAHLDPIQAANFISPSKDADGLTAMNLGLVLSNFNATFAAPATPKAVLALLEHYQIPLAGKQALVIGRSRLVGIPTAMLLLHANATVAMAHSQTQNLHQMVQQADIIISAVGHPGLIQPQDIRPHHILIDVGMTKTDGGWVGDIDPMAQQAAAGYSPVPGGVGPLTVACLLENVVTLAQIKH